MFCPLQLPGDYSNVKKTGIYRIQWWDDVLLGLCYYNQRLFTLEKSPYHGKVRTLRMYKVSAQGLTSLYFSTEVYESMCPRVDGHSQQVYIPRGLSRGVSVVSWEGNRMTPQPTLKCVGVCWSVGVISPHTLCACDCDSGSVSVVSVTNDTVTARLNKPEEVRDKVPRNTAVLGDSVLVWYEGHNLVVYENGVSRPGTMVTWPAGLQSVWGMSSDGVSRFFVCGSNAVWTLDVSGKLCDKIDVDFNSEVMDCTVVDGKLFVGCYSRDIIVLSPQ